MRGTLSLSVTRTRLSAVLVRRRHIIWWESVAIDVGETISEATERLLDSAPIGRLFTPRTRVVVGEAYAQVKELHGVPPMKHPRFTSHVVRENAASFFALAGYRIVVSDVERRSDGTMWGAAFAGDMVEQVISSLSMYGLARPIFLPALVALASLASSGSHQTTDDSVTTTFTVEDGAVVAIARSASTGEAEDIVLTPAAATAIEPDDIEYLRAYAGAVARPTAGPHWRSPPPARRTQMVRRGALTLAALLFTATAAAALLASGARAHRAIGQLNHELASTRASQLEAARTEAALRRVTGELERVERIRAGRGRTTLLIAGLTQALPESTALVSLRLDSLEGSFVALTPHAVDILPELSAVDQISGARIVGSVTRESRGSAQLERATIRFRTAKPRAPVVRASTAAPAAEARK